MPSMAPCVDSTVKLTDPEAWVPLALLSATGISTGVGAFSDAEEKKVRNL